MGGCNILSCKSPCYESPLRRVIVVIILFSIIISYIHRTSLNVAIVEMVEKKAVDITCKSAGGPPANIKKIEGGKTKWTQQTQSIILLGFYILYIITHFPGGYISDRYGARWPMIIGMLLSTITTGLIPIFVTKTHWGFTVGLRIIAGAAQGVILPSITSFLSRWVPASERALLGGIVFAGGSMGSILGNLSSGLIIGYFHSWPLVFYFGAICGVLWLIVSYIWLHSTPDSHPYILPREIEFLKENIKKKERRPFPLGRILLDVRVWAMVMAQCGHGYTIFTLLTNLPKYMNEVLGFNIKKNAYASSFPYVAQYISSVGFGILSDYLVNKKNANITLVRVIWCTIGNMVPCAFLVCAAYADCNKMWALIFISLALFFKGPFFASLKVNGMDLSHHHAGLLMALTNGIGAIGAIISPPTIAYLAPKNSHKQWHLIFWIVFIVNGVCSIFYIIFGKAKRAKWDYTPEEWEAFQAEPKKKVPWYLEKTPKDFKEGLVKKAKLELDLATADQERGNKNVEIAQNKANEVPVEDVKKKKKAEDKVANEKKMVERVGKKVEKLKKKLDILVAESLA